MKQSLVEKEGGSKKHKNVLTYVIFERSLSNDFEPVQKAIQTDCGAFETGMHFVKRVIYDVESNWKVVNFFLGLNILAQCNAMGRKTFGKSDLIQSLRFFDPALLKSLDYLSSFRNYPGMNLYSLGFRYTLKAGRFSGKFV